jgi:cytochrome c biogenesis protein CcmG/thiol:disulfide interchange protein DsbE
LIVGACQGSTDVKVGDPVPDISAVGIDGQPVKLSDFRGRPVIVNFWASWCVPCREEMPLLKQELAKHGPNDLAIVGVIFKDTADPARQFAQSFGATWPSATDADGAIAKAYRVVAPPQSYFIDRSGILRSIQIGEMLQTDFDREYALIDQ